MEVAQEIETEIRKVGAPLAGLIRSTRLEIGTKIVGAFAVVCLLVWLSV
jgi:hypothetical protein